MRGMINPNPIMSMNTTENNMSNEAFFFINKFSSLEYNNYFYIEGRK
jgi:hypothetical protein